MRQLLFPLFFLLCLSVQGQQSTSIDKQNHSIKTIDMQAILLLVNKPIVIKDSKETTMTNCTRTIAPMPQSVFHIISGKDFRRIASGRN